MECDILIQNGKILTMNEEKKIIDKGYIAVHKDRIIDIGEQTSSYRAKKVLDATNCLVLPGLINTHTHAAMSLFRGLADDLPLKSWLEDYIWPAEAKFMNEENVRIGTKLGLIEMIQSGTTTFNDMYFFEDVVGEIAAEFGMRAYVGETILDFSTPHCDSPKAAIEYTKKMFEKWKGHSLVTVTFAPHSPYTCSIDLLREIHSLANQENALIHIHLAETEIEKKLIQGNDGKSPVQFLAQNNLLSENIIAAHCVHLSEEDIEILKDTAVGIAHNPVSNMKLASGTANYPLWKKKGITKIGLGTDGATSNNNLSMLKDINICALLHKNHFQDPKVAKAQEIVETATIGGAKTLCCDQITGSLEVDKAADIILLDVQNSHSIPLFNPYSHLVYAAQSQDVKTVLINGKIVMENRKLSNINVQQILNDAAEVAKMIHKK